MTIDNEQKTPLHAAAIAGFPGVVEAMYSFGGDINAKDAFGATPLRAAVVRGRQDMIAMLHSLGADVNVPDNLGVSPLHAAALAGHAHLVRRVPQLRARPHAAVARHQGACLLSLYRAGILKKNGHAGKFLLS